MTQTGTVPTKRVAVLRWLVITALTLLVLLAPVPGASAAPAERVFRIQANRFAYTPATLKVNPGDRVTIELASTDVVHGLAVDGYNVETTSDPGQVARVSFVADREGSFRFRCTVTCGNMHPFMIGKLEVGTNTLVLRAIGLAIVALFAGVVSLWK